MVSNEIYINQSIRLHSALAPTVAEIIKNILSKENIEYLSINFRVKDENSISEKIKRKRYSNPEVDLTDISGIRVIAFLESDIKRIQEILEDSFEIIEEHSTNKNTLLSTDKIGYRSIHYVAKLGKKRACIPEYSDIHNLYFEIQIRTVLQHAWAELSHDRNYKFKQKLPIEIERKLNLFAGLLEIADSGFCEISDAIDRYEKTIESIISNASENIEINSISLVNFIKIWSQKEDFTLQENSKTSNIELSDTIKELSHLGINSTNELMEIIPKDFAKYAKKYDYSVSAPLLITDWMMIHDWRKTAESPFRGWIIEEDDEIKKLKKILTHYFSKDEIEEMINSLK